MFPLILHFGTETLKIKVLFPLLKLGLEHHLRKGQKAFENYILVGIKIQMTTTLVLIMSSNLHTHSKWRQSLKFLIAFSVLINICWPSSL